MMQKAQGGDFCINEAVLMQKATVHSYAYP